jgi:methylase of polypeptide subunit release factors
VLEIGSTQGAEVARVLREAFDDVEVLQDLAGRDRVVRGRLR